MEQLRKPFFIASSIIISEKGLSSKRKSYQKQQGNQIHERFLFPCPTTLSKYGMIAADFIDFFCAM
jgi:hypothetical protein